MKVINKYNETEFVYNIDCEAYTYLKDEISSAIDNFVDEVENVYNGQNNKMDTDLESIKQAMILIKLAIVDVSLAYDKRNLFIDNFIKQVDNLLKKYNLYKQKDVRYKTYELSKIIVSKVKKLIFKFFLLKNPKMDCLYIESLSFYQLLVIDNKIDVVYYEYTNLDLEKMQQIFNVKFVKMYNKPVINLKVNDCKNILTKCETEFIGISGNTSYVDLREMYKLLSYYPTVTTIIECIKERFEKDTEVYLTLPLFLDEKVILFNSENHGYLNVYFENPNYYKDFVLKVIKLAEVYKLKIIVPSSMNYEDYLWWYLNIKQIAKKHGLDKRISVGILLDELELQFDIEKYENVDLVLIDLDELDYENDLEEISKPYFKSNLEEELRYMHRFLKFKKIDHPVISYRIKDAGIIEKLIIMGFDKFIYPKCKLLEINKALCNYESRRGKYVGLYKRRKEA